MHISKRDTISRGKAWTIRAIAILLALIVDGIIIYAIVKMNPLKVYVSLASGAFGTSKRMWFTIRDCMILTCIAIGLAPAFKMRFWNVGAEGQMLVGGIATAFWMINFAGKMNIVMLFLCMAISAIVAGGIWGLIPGFFKAKWNTNETLFTLMMNYIAIQLTSFAVSKWENPPGSNSIGTINSKGDVKYVGWIGNMFSDGYNKDFMWTVIVVLVLATLVYLYLKYTKHGYEIAVVGDSENTARYAGIRVPRIYVRTMALSGALCGFAGFLAVSADRNGRRPRLHRDHRGLARQDEPVRHDPDLGPAVVPRQGRGADRFRLWPQRIRLADHLGRHSVLHPRQRVLHQLSGQSRRQAQVRRS